MHLLGYLHHLDLQVVLAAFLEPTHVLHLQVFEPPVELLLYFREAFL